nr:MAG TPA: HIGH POTENTIAL IRON SULFUR PROTEIN TRANSFER(IRON-SULFUR PROTEIN) [Caudoviricetes sp.]
MCKNINKCCGNCALFLHEDIYGYGSCDFSENPHCGDNACQAYKLNEL